MSGQGGSPAPRAGGINRSLIENVEVSLEAIIGTATLTVAELGALKPDSLVTLDAALNQPVQLRLNGVVVATGELVAVGDSYGVRIVEMAK